MPAPKQEKLLNGLKILMWSDAKADKVSVKIRIHSGSAFDPQGKEGLMQMLADNLFPNEASREFFKEDLGGDLEIITSYDYIQINASSKPDGFLTMLETVATAVSNPAIDKEITAKLRAALLAKVAALEGDPSYVADQAVAKRLFGTFPYGRPQLGTADSLKKIEFGELIGAKNRFLTADNATIAISGNFDKATGFKAVRRYFGGWLKADKKVPATFRQPDEPPITLEKLTLPYPPTARLAIRGVARSDKDRPSSVVFTTILQNRLRAIWGDSSRVSVRNIAYFLPGIIVVGVPGGLNADGTGFLSSQIEFVSKAMSDPISEAEFRSAKESVRMESSKIDVTAYWLDAETYKIADPNADARLIESVTLADLKGYGEKASRLSLVKVLISPPPPAE